MFSQVKWRIGLTAFFQRNNSDSTVGRLRAGAKFDGPRQRPELTEPILFPSRG
jgi:hypothetical protein